MTRLWELGVEVMLSRTAGIAPGEKARKRNPKTEGASMAPHQRRGRMKRGGGFGLGG